MKSTSDILSEAQEAFQVHKSSCFWFMDTALIVSAENLPSILAGLRSHGDRRAYVLSRQLESAWGEAQKRKKAPAVAVSVS